MINFTIIQSAGRKVSTEFEVWRGEGRGGSTTEIPVNAVKLRE
jgi:hypothetical protein